MDEYITNAQLKELLKEVKDYVPEFETPMDILAKIDEVLRLGQLLYNNAHIFCKRKYERWLAFYESRRANGVNSGNEMAI